MGYKIDFSQATSQQIVSALCERVKEIRLAKNISQLQLSKDAGVSRATIERMENGNDISLGTFVRVLTALNVQSGLQVTLPDMSIRPVERVQMLGRERKRSYPRKKKVNINKQWNWNEKGEN
jgi:putative transcriptional regulator